MSFRELGHRRLASGVFLHFDRRYLIDKAGRAHPRDVVRHPGGVAVLPVDGNRVWLVSQFRTAVGEQTLEIPAGKLDPGETNVPDAARRELEEEVGATASELFHLTTMFPSPGYTDESIHIYAATGLKFGPRRPEGAEEINSAIATISVAEALHRIETGEIKDSKTQIALLLWVRQRS
ncbi:MAG TPA: NUDIX hydrolase [Acidimicrobiia bacterium]